MVQQTMREATRILLVDDDREMLEELAEGLAFEEIVALTASSAAEAMMLLTRNPSLVYVVTDLIMPNIGGVEFIGKLVSLRPKRQLVFIVVTGVATLEYVLSAIRYGVTDFLQKPVAAGEIANVIRMQQAKRQGDAIDSDGGCEGVTSPSRLKVLEKLMQLRKERNKLLGNELVGDPVWEMLLDLALAQVRGEAISTTSLCIGEGIPTTTDLRRLDVLEGMCLIERRTDRSDRRRVMITLTRLGRERIQAFFDQFRKHVLPLRETVPQTRAVSTGRTGNSGMC